MWKADIAKITVICIIIVVVTCYLWKGSEHASGTEYVRVLNIPWLQNVMNMSEYAWIIPGYPWIRWNAWLSQNMDEYA